jgi:outer membrane receptor protein involved in Fe transport
LTLGGNFGHDIIRNDDVGHFTSSNSGVGPARYDSFSDRADQNVSTKAAFSSVDWKLTDTLTAQTGVRYTSQDRDFSGCLLDGGNGQLAGAFTFLRAAITGETIATPPGACVSFANATTFLPVPAQIRSSLDQNNVSWKAGLNWKPAPDTLVYGNVTKGFKSGAYEALPAVFADQLTPVTQESVLAYELGVKTRITPAIDVSAAAFYYNYRNKQLEAFIDIPPFGDQPALRNIPKSTVKGGEVDVSARPIHGLTLTLGATYVQSKVTDNFIGQDPFGAELNFKDMAFPNTPKWQVLGGADYEFPVAGGYTAFLGGNLTYRSDTDSFFVIGNDPDFRIGSYALLDLHAGFVTRNDKLRVQLWGRNVTDRFYITQATHLPDTINRTAGMPATYGITAFFKF